MSMAHVADLAWIFGLFALHLIVPGPNMLYICVSASRGQRRRALAFVAGTSIGTALWAAIAAFGAMRLVAEAPVLIDGLTLGIGVALVALGLRALVTAFEHSEIVTQSGRDTVLEAFAHGILLTMANGNEIVFWSAIMVLSTGPAAVGATPDLGFAWTLVIGVAVISVIVEGALACLVSTGRVARWIGRCRRPLEAALGVAFCVTGVVLLQLP